MDALLLVGNGGREHCLAWKLAQSPLVGRILVAPGNGGTANEPKCENVAVEASNLPALVALARDRKIDFAVIGPEVPLAAGIVDAFVAKGIPAFGPAAAAARLEASKAFARDFMAQHGIPSPAYRVFDRVEEALVYLGSVGIEVVIKASGLAAGKGVIIPETQEEAAAALLDIMQQHRFGAAGDTVVIEERLAGQEVSVLAFVDGERWALMPLAQDHKQVFDGDRGPNTGGMGVYAPAPLLSPEALARVGAEVFRPVVAGMAAAGIPYRGVLYAGLMLAADGFEVLEFNCRFGDPETQAILPLLDSDLYSLLRTCEAGCLDPAAVRWQQAASACVIAAAPGYPGDYPVGLPIQGVDEANAHPGVKVFHGGTSRDASGGLVSAGGRVLSVTATADSKQEALDRAYVAMAGISFPGMHYRRDIGARSSSGNQPDASQKNP